MLSPVLSTQHTSTLMIQIPSPENRSVSPLSSTSSSTDIKGIRLFRIISRKLFRKSHDDFNFGEDVESTSSADSCSSTSTGRSPRSRKSVSCTFRTNNTQRMSSSSTETISETHSIKHRNSISVDNFTRAFQNLSLRSRSHSCNNNKELKRKGAKKSSPKKILRSPMTYTYVKGLSGLPTQRVPRTPTNACFNGTCGYSVQYIASLHR